MQRPSFHLQVLLFSPRFYVSALFNCFIFYLLQRLIINPAYCLLVLQPIGPLTPLKEWKPFLPKIFDPFLAHWGTVLCEIRPLARAWKGKQKAPQQYPGGFSRIIFCCKLPRVVWAGLRAVKVKSGLFSHLTFPWGQIHDYTVGCLMGGR